MNKRVVSLCAATLLILQPLVWTQNQGAPFDLERARKELEIMEGILRTTLDFTMREGREQRADEGEVALGSFGLSNISSYYLQGQGALFIIPSSSVWRGSGYSSGFDAGELAYAEVLEMASDQERLASELAALASERAVLAAGAIPSPAPKPDAVPPEPPAVPPEPPTPPTPPSPPAPGTTQARAAAAAQSSDRARERLRTLQERAQRRREATEERQTKYREVLDRMRDTLVDALAHHGDSLTQVNAREYITLIIAENRSADTPAQILSVQRSHITDYKAGRITLNDFKQRVLQYTN